MTYGYSKDVFHSSDPSNSNSNYISIFFTYTIDESNRLRRKVQELELDVTEPQRFKQELDDLKALIKKDK